MFQIREVALIRKLQTAYSLGLHDDIMGIVNMSRTSTVSSIEIVLE